MRRTWRDRASALQLLSSLEDGSRTHTPVHFMCVQVLPGHQCGLSDCGDCHCIYSGAFGSVSCFEGPSKLCVHSVLVAISSLDSTSGRCSRSSAHQHVPDQPIGKRKRKVGESTKLLQKALQI